MLHIKYKGFDKNITAAVRNVNVLFQYYHFYHCIRQHLRFDMSDISPRQIARLLEHTELTLTVDLYYSVNPFSKALSYDDPEKPNVIHLNKWNLNQSLGSLCNTIVHQCIHALNAQHPHFNFGHSITDTAAQYNTAPYWIANLAQQIILRDKTAREALYHEKETDIPQVRAIPPAYAPRYSLSV